MSVDRPIQDVIEHLAPNPSVQRSTCPQARVRRKVDSFLTTGLSFNGLVNNHRQPLFYSYVLGTGATALGLLPYEHLTFGSRRLSKSVLCAEMPRSDGKRLEVYMTGEKRARNI